MLHPHRIDVFEDYIYGAGPKNGVFRVQKFGRGSVEYLALDVGKTKGVLISHRYKQLDCKYNTLYNFLYWWIFFLMTLKRNYFLNWLNYFNVLTPVT